MTTFTFMIYEPQLSGNDKAVLAYLDDLHKRLRFYLVRPRRWHSNLRRDTLARSIQGSNAVDGYPADIEAVAALLEEEEPLKMPAETRLALAGYRDAMAYVLELADKQPELDASLIGALHFVAMKRDLAKQPGRWRPGDGLVECQDGNVVYHAPERERLDQLMAEALDWVKADTGPVVVRASMAHLNLALIHPFTHGNGRVARCAHTFVLAHYGLVAPEFLSIEEYVGDHPVEYGEALTEVSQGQWSPERSVEPWLRFCLTAHYRQAQRLLHRIQQVEALWDRCQQLVARHGLPERSVPALVDAARGWGLNRSLYAKGVKAASGDELSHPAASRDLRALAQAGLLLTVKDREQRTYQPAEPLRTLSAEVTSLQPPLSEQDPYVALLS